MTRKMCSIITVLILMAFTSCAKEKEDNTTKEIIPIALTTQQKALVSSNNIFGFEIFHKINSNEGSGKNLFISPLSLSLALAMTYNGADGETKIEMQNILGFPGYSEEEVNGYFQMLSTTLPDLDPTVELGIGNSIWYRKDFSVLPDFVTVNQTYYDSEVQPLDFNNPASVNTINQWVASKTNNKITKVLDNISSEQVMFLINAIYFKGQWTSKFESSATADATFHGTAGDEAVVPFMNQKGAFKYYSNDSLQLLNF